MSDHALCQLCSFKVVRFEHIESVRVNTTQYYGIILYIFISARYCLSSCLLSKSNSFYVKMYLATVESDSDGEWGGVRELQ